MIQVSNDLSQTLLIEKLSHSYVTNTYFVNFLKEYLLCKSHNDE